jgi:lactoylglutathione lyase
LKIRDTHHVALYSTNYAALRAFYTEVLGLEEVGRFPNRNIVFLQVGGTTIELVEQSESEAAGKLGWAHFAFEVEDCDAACAELKARGISFHVEPKDFPPEAPSVRIAFFRDPDGNELELVQPLEGRYPR